jgi:Ribbon-helix-helix domain
MKGIPMETTAAPETVRWSLKVSPQTNLELRKFLANSGARKGDLSKFVEQAVRREIFARTLDEVHTQNANVEGDEIDAALATALRETRQRAAVAAAV